MNTSVTLIKRYTGVSRLSLARTRGRISLWLSTSHHAATLYYIMLGHVSILGISLPHEAEGEKTETIAENIKSLKFNQISESLLYTAG